MRLRKLELKNFKGVRDFTLLSDGGDVEVRGDNGTGKSTLGDALFWLLFNKGQDFKTCPVKTLDEFGNELHHLEHSVLAEFDLPDGGSIVLEKIMREEWVRKRGSATEEFTGHTTTYKVNQVPCRKKDYNEAIAKVIPGEELFLLLTSPFYFSSVLPWQKRRTILLEMCGEVPQEEVLEAAGGKLEEVPRILDGHTVAEAKTILDAKLKEINKELKTIPIRIDEAQRNLPDVKGLSASNLERERDKLLARRKGIVDAQRSAFVSGRDAELAKLEDQIAEVRATLSAKRDVTASKLSELVTEAKQKLADVMVRIQKSKAGQAILEDIDRELEILRKEYKVTKAKELDLGEAICPTCGQPMPTELKKQKFDEWKKGELARLKEKGANLAKRREESAKEVESMERLMAAKRVAEDDLIEAQGKLTEFNKKSIYSNRLAMLEQKVAEVRKRPAPEMETPEELTEIDTRLAEIQESLILLSTYSQYRDRIAELEDREKELSSLWSQTDGDRYILEEYTRMLVTMLERRIEETLNFPGLSVKMFENQINGGMTEVCEILHNGVPFNKGLNHGAQITCGLHIIGILSSYYGYSLPVVVDNAEAVTRIPETSTQVIKLVVDPKFKELTVAG